ncbi:lysophospholipid acyltransferase family protein [Granulicella arctica]|uniref:lysophospholipid acyltransferase family protein n=1 Tax=Granulicella arctica TaxID=940613 RepID=UPI0021E0D99A|nr:lysophospholipid acyltransferase family protein [Granulicella arctica]
MLAGMFVEAGTELILKRPSTREKRADWLHRFCARSMRRMGITVTVHGRFPERGSLITNHQTYLDIVMLASLHPCVFVSKAELVSVPVLGWMTTMSGTVFVERGRGGSALRASAGMKAVSKAGLPVVFFPEGTTTSGREMLPFRSGLLSQAMASGEPITAGYIKYTMGANNGSDVSVEENVSWGNLPMFTHIFTFLGLRGVHVDVHFGDAPIRFSSDLMHRKAAAIEAHAAVLLLKPL